MRTELTEAFEQRLHNTPDPDAILHRVRAGVGAHRRRRHLRTGAVASAAVAVIVVTSMVVVDRLGTNELPAGKRGEVNEATTSIQLGWVPDGLEPPVIRSTQAGDQISYPYVIDDRGGRDYLTVGVDNMTWTPALEPPGWREIRVNDRPAFERVDDQYAVEIVFQLPSGRWAAVERGQKINHGEKGIDPAVLQQEAMRVASSVRESAGVGVRVGFVPTYLPAGQRVIGVQAATGAAAGHGEIASASGSLALKSVSELSMGLRYGGQSPIADLGAGVTISVATVPPPDFGIQQPPTSNPIANIQGRPAYRSPSDGLIGESIWVADFHGGWLRVIATVDGSASAKNPDYEPKRLPTDELVKIAEGVRWVG